MFGEPASLAVGPNLRRWKGSRKVPSTLGGKKVDAAGNQGVRLLVGLGPAIAARATTDNNCTINSSSSSSHHPGFKPTCQVPQYSTEPSTVTENQDKKTDPIIYFFLFFFRNTAMLSAHTALKQRSTHPTVVCVPAAALGIHVHGTVLRMIRAPGLITPLPPPIARENLMSLALTNLTPALLHPCQLLTKARQLADPMTDELRA